MDTDTPLIITISDAHNDTSLTIKPKQRDLRKRGREEGYKPIYMRVKTELSTSFKSYAAARGLTMVELFVEAFELIKQRDANRLNLQNNTKSPEVNKDGHI
jgi:hypothetical protein